MSLLRSLLDHISYSLHSRGGDPPRAPPARNQTTIPSAPPTDAFSLRPLMYFLSGLDSLAAFRATGAELWRPYFLCLLAEACMETGRFDYGLSALTEALAAADEHENRSYEAEVHRLKGE